MKRLLIGTLSTLTVVGMATAVKAEHGNSHGMSSYRHHNMPQLETEDSGEWQPYSGDDRSDLASDASDYQTTPFELSYLAYTGYLEEAGIDSYAALLQNLRTGETEAADVIAAGVDAGRLSPTAAEDEEYERLVQFSLRHLWDQGNR